MNTTDEMIACVCHAVNKAYRENLGDMSQPPWSELTPELRLSVVNAVRFARGPEITPATSHQNWIEAKVRAGWRYGTAKDPAMKTHPCMVPYEQLPEAQRFNATLFLAVIQGFRTAEVGDAKPSDSAQIARLRRCLSAAQKVKDRRSAGILAAALEKLTGEKVEAMPFIEAGMPGEAATPAQAPTQMEYLENALRQAEASKDEQSAYVLRKKIEAVDEGRPVPSGSDILAEREEKREVELAARVALEAEAVAKQETRGVEVAGEPTVATEEERAAADVGEMDEEPEPAKEAPALGKTAESAPVDEPAEPADEMPVPPSTWQARRLCDQEAIDIRKVTYTGKRVVLSDVRNHLEWLGRI